MRPRMEKDGAVVQNRHDSRKSLLALIGEPRAFLQIGS